MSPCVLTAARPSPTTRCAGWVLPQQRNSFSFERLHVNYDTTLSVAGHSGGHGAGPTLHSGALLLSLFFSVWSSYPHWSHSSPLFPSKNHTSEIAITMSPETSELFNPMNMLFCMLLKKFNEIFLLSEEKYDESQGI